MRTALAMTLLFSSALTLAACSDTSDYGTGTDTDYSSSSSLNAGSNTNTGAIQGTFESGTSPSSTNEIERY